MEVDSTFISLLEGLTTHDNNIRKESEKTYNLCKEDTDKSILSLKLLAVISNTNVIIHIRQLSIVLLRKLLIQDNDGIYYSMNNEGQTILRSNLLLLLKSETNATIKAKVCDIVGELASLVLEDVSEWPEVLTYAYQSTTSPDPLERESGLALIGILAQTLIEYFNKGNDSSSVIKIFQTCLVDPSNNGRVCISAIRSLGMFLQCIYQDSDYEQFQVLMSTIIGGLILTISMEITNTSSEELSNDAISLAYADTLIIMSDEVPQFFNKQLNDIYQSVVEIIEMTTISSQFRNLLIEFLVGLCVSSPKIARKLVNPLTGDKGHFAKRLFPFCIKMMLSLQDDAEWLISETQEDNIESVADSDVGETAIDRISKALGLRMTYPILSSLISTLLGGSTWQHVHAGLKLLGNYLEVSMRISDKIQLNRHRLDIITTLSSFANNSHPRIRSATFESICQLFIYHGKDLNNESVEQMLLLILGSCDITINSSPRVRRNIFLSLINVMEVANTDILELHISKILDSITKALTIGPVMIQEICISGITSLAEQIKGPQIAQFYDQLMPILKQLLVHSHQQGLESLWGLGLECCALVGESSGKEKFYPDALEMMTLLVSMQGDNDKEDSGNRGYLMKAWTRIARCLGAEFHPYLPLVMDNLVSSITQDVSAGTGDIDLDDLDDRSDIDVIEDGDGMLKAVRTSAVEEQGTACQLLCLMVEKLQEYFYPHVEISVRSIAPLLKSPHDDVRTYSMIVIPELIRSCAKATLPDREALTTLSEYLFGVLVDAIQSESDIQLIMTGLQSLKLSLQYACIDWSAHSNIGMSDPPNPTPNGSIKMLNIAQMTAITQCSERVLQDSIQRRAILKAEAQVLGVTDEDDEQDEEFFLTESMELHYNIAELVGALFRTHGSDYLPVYMERWHDMLHHMSNSQCLKEDRQFSFCIISDVIEFGLGDSNDLAASYFVHIMQDLCDCLVQNKE
jgi:hypothetical protein